MKDLKNVAKDTIFYPKRSLNINGKLLSLNSPWVMGILNVTPDSFYDGGKYEQEESTRKQIRKMLEEGARIIDVGAASSRPGAESISPSEEIARLKPALGILGNEFPEAIVSVDTYQSEVVRGAVYMGAHIVNDISGGTLDKMMFKTVAGLKVPYVMMHMLGKPKNMQNSPTYGDVFESVCLFFSQQLEKLKDLGVSDVILDPGFGFGKTLEHNYQLINRLEDFRIFDEPILAGISRKSMIYKLLDTAPEEALNGTTVLNTICLQKGASILRVHDVKAAVEAIKILTFTQNLA